MEVIVGTQWAATDASVSLDTVGSTAKLTSMTAAPVCVITTQIHSHVVDK